MAEYVAIVRGKGIKTEFFYSEANESKANFVQRIAEIYAIRLNGWTADKVPTNTLTIEYVFKE